MTIIFYESGGYVVTDKMVTTPKATHRLADIQSVSMRYEVALTALFPAIGLGLGALLFARYLYVEEFILIGGGCLAVALLSTRVGTLQVNSLALANTSGMGRTWGYTWRLKKVAAAISEAMSHESEAPVLPGTHLVTHSAERHVSSNARPGFGPNPSSYVDVLSQPSGEAMPPERKRQHLVVKTPARPSAENSQSCRPACRDRTPPKTLAGQSAVK